MGHPPFFHPLSVLCPPSAYPPSREEGVQRKQRRPRPWLPLKAALTSVPAIMLLPLVSSRSPSAFSSLMMLLIGWIIRDGYLKVLKNCVSRGPFPDKVVYRFGLRMWMYLLELPFSLELMPLFFIPVQFQIVRSLSLHFQSCLCHFGFVLLLKSFTYIFMMASHLENCRMCP